jgi:hypothetical protein
MKGPSTRHVTVRYAPRPADRQPSPEAVGRLNDSTVVAFLVDVDDPERQGTYFTPPALGTCASLMRLSPRGETELRGEIATQRTFEPRSGVADGVVAAKVASLRERMLEVRTQQSAMMDACSLGREAVPALISQLSDRRPLPQKSMRYENPRGTFENTSWYTPQVVADALVTCLDRITGETFGFLANGASTRERDRTVRAWQIYLQRLTAGADGDCPSGKGPSAERDPRAAP